MSETEIQEGSESFEGVEGRLQFLREINGAKIYNDNNATTPEATMAALKALQYGSATSIILIIGGSDKGLDMDGLIEEIKKKCKSVVFLAGTGTDTIKSEFPDAKIYEDVKSAFNAAFASAQKGDTVLFSPAFASFGMFKNEYERNDQFLALVRSL